VVVGRFRPWLAGVILLALASTSASAGDLDEIAAPGTAALAAARARLTPAQRKIDRRLHSLTWPALRTARRGPLVPYENVADPARVYVRVGEAAGDAARRLRDMGATVELADQARGRLQAVVSGARLRALADEPWVVSIRPAERGRPRTGTVTSEGDAASHADMVRALGYDGTGVTVAVISDGIDHASSAVASGDLPTVTVPAAPGCTPGSGDEGTALLEIVHDLAPGAPLLFSGGGASGLAFANAVGCLQAAGARVIVDDLGFFDEPYFEDGPVALAVRAAVDAGVSYHTAAGNDAQAHVEQPFRASTNDFHDFNGGPVDQADDMVVPPGGTAICVLQWNDPFGGSANDYDLGIFDASLNLITASTNLQTGSQDPLEIAGVINNSASPQVIKVAIQKSAGADRLLDLFCPGAFLLQYDTPAGSIFSQAALPEAVTVGAIDVSDPGLQVVESYSSEGPVTIFFPSPAMRAKPDIAGFDGVQITNAGGFPPGCPPDCRFFGTSAAAPHSAAVAALLLDKMPTLLPSEVALALRAGADDVGIPGFDATSGAGRLDALRAVGNVCLPGDTCDDGNVCTVDACNGRTCTHTAVQCDDGNACNGVEMCDPAIGCVAGQPLACDDGDACTVDSCDPSAGCRFVDLPSLDFVSCALEQHLRPLLPSPAGERSPRGVRTARALLARLGKADGEVNAARKAAPRQARKRLARADHLVARIEKLALRRSGELGIAVAGPIATQAATIMTRIRDVRQAL
jgi:subtilisin family serine protease